MACAHMCSVRRCWWHSFRPCFTQDAPSACNDSMLKTHSQNQLQSILQAHLDWLFSQGKDKRTGQQADLTRADLTNANLESKDLRHAILRRACLKNTFLFGADLSDAHLEGADLDHTDLLRATLTNTHLSGANLFRANFRDAILNGTELSQAIFPLSCRYTLPCWERQGPRNSILFLR